MGKVVVVCGNYNCRHCSVYGKCMLSHLAIGTGGKCSQFLHNTKIDSSLDEDLDLYTNRC
jgi:hypothetical protein